MIIKITTTGFDTLKLIDNLKAAEDRLARIAAFDALALVSQRIQNKGMGTNGRITSKASPKKGAYSKAYGNKRAKKGFQTSYIDLTVTGDLMDRGFSVFRVPEGWGAGFSSTPGGAGVPSPADKSEYLEAYFGELFSLNNEEISIIAKAITKAVNDIVRASR